MTRKQLASSIRNHMLNLLKFDPWSAMELHPDCFYLAGPSASYTTFPLHSLSRFESWPKMKLEQVLFDILRNELDSVKLSSYATERASKRARERSMLSTSKLKALELSSNTNLLGMPKYLQDSLLEAPVDMVYRCNKCMHVLDVKDDVSCTNTSCENHKPVRTTGYQVIDRT